MVKEEIERKKEQRIKQTRINDTDEDSRLMQMKKKDYGNGYNPQNVTEKRFILSTRVPNTAGDAQELIPSLEKFKEAYGVVPERLLADK
ncbi:MAG: hypothetical protein U9Q15_03515 [Patescibacteria group bacterium]|nr:hypothetical protein [Patescibacteria group bacterium]